MFEEVRPFLLALAIGLLIGIERERSRYENHPSRPFGSRTFALIGFLGAATAQIGNNVVAAAIAFFVGALSLIHISEPTRPPLLSRMPSSA